MRNPTYEQALTKQGVEFEYVEAVPVEDISEARGRTMQARLVAIDSGLVDQYREMLVDGFEPPPLLLWKHGRSMLVPLDGNQRLLANSTCDKKHRLKSFSAYVVRCEELMVAERLCWQFNNLVNGRRLSYEECLQHAITMVRKYEQPVTPTAKDWGVKSYELASRVRELELRDLGARKGLELKNVAQQTLLALNPLGSLGSLGEDVLVKVMQTVAETGVGHDVVKELVSDVGRARTSDRKEALIDEFKTSAKTLAAKAATKGGKLRVNPQRHPRVQLHKLLDKLEDLLGEYKDDALRDMNKSDRERYAGAGLTISNRLIGLYGLGSYVKGQGVA